LVLVDSGLGGLALFDSALLLGLASGVVGGGGETKSFPDGANLGRSKVGLSNDGEVDIESGESAKTSDFGALFGGTVHSESKTVLVEALLEGGLGDAFLTFPKVIETNSGSLEETEIFHLHGVSVNSGRSLRDNLLLSEGSKRSSGRLTPGGGSADR